MGSGVLTRFRFVYSKVSPLEGAPMESGDRISRVGVRGHGHESKAARFAGIPVLDHCCLANEACCGKKVLKVLSGSSKGEISYVEFSCHYAVIPTSR
jgi:hypothetical protein